MTQQARVPDNSLLGRAVDYPRHYDASLLFPIARSVGRSALSWMPPALHRTRPLDAYDTVLARRARQPMVATATFTVPADSPHLVESKSLKLYLNSFNATRFDDAEAVRARIAADMSQPAGAPVSVRFGLPPLAEDDATSSNRFLLDHPRHHHR
jgi:7-cyano-7-deazaguanine reductase